MITKKIKIWVVALIALACSVQLVDAANSRGGPGSSAVLTLLEPFSAAVDAKSNASVAGMAEPYFINSNPAALNWLTGIKTSFMYNRGISGDNYLGFTAGYPFTYDVIGMGLQYYSTGDVSMYSMQGDKITETGQRDIILHLAWATSNFNIASGANLKLIHSSIFGKTGTSVAADIGTQYREENYNFGIAIRNLGTDIKYLNYREKLPLNIAAGLFYTEKYTDDHVFDGNFDLLYFVNEREYVFLTGIEYTYLKQFVLRGGYKFNITHTGSRDILATAGLGINFDYITVDYGLKFSGDVNSPHTVSVNYRF